MKKLYVCFLVLLCLAFTGCNYNPFEETSIQIYNKCPWELYLNVSGGDLDESLTVGKTAKKIRVEYGIEYTITISSPYDYYPRVIRTTPKMGTNKWTLEWSTYTGGYTLTTD